MYFVDPLSKRFSVCPCILENISDLHGEDLPTCTFIILFLCFVHYKVRLKHQVFIIIFNLLVHFNLFKFIDCYTPNKNSSDAFLCFFQETFHYS